MSGLIASGKPESAELGRLIAMPTLEGGASTEAAMNRLSQLDALDTASMSADDAQRTAYELGYMTAAERGLLPVADEQVVAHGKVMSVAVALSGCKAYVEQLDGMDKSLKGAGMSEAQRKDILVSSIRNKAQADRENPDYVPLFTALEAQQGSKKK